jgi:hypothetical protein
MALLPTERGQHPRAMSRTTLASAVLVFFTAAACAVESPTEWRILNASLASADAVEFSFVAAQAGPHQASLSLNANHPNRRLASLTRIHLAWAVVHSRVVASCWEAVNLRPVPATRCA